MSREEVGASMEVPGVGRQTLSDCKWSGKMEKIEQKLKKNKESYSQKEKIWSKTIEQPEKKKKLH